MFVALADTHALLWYVFGDARLSPGAREALDRPDGRVAVSAISLAEIVYLEEKGRLPAGTHDGVRNLLGSPEHRLTLVPVDAATVAAMRRVPRDEVPDLPDRIIAGTALQLGVPLVTRDRRIRATSLTTVW